MDHNRDAAYCHACMNNTSLRIGMPLWRHSRNSVMTRNCIEGDGNRSWYLAVWATLYWNRHVTICNPNFVAVENLLATTVS